MPRGSYTQTRLFNYNKTVGTTLTVGGDLLSATNPENGTVTYTYDSNHRLKTKTDANLPPTGYWLSYVYDGFGRLTVVNLSTNGSGFPVTQIDTRLRTYTYDQNTIDSTYSQNVNGRLATITYPVISYDVPTSSRQGTTTFTDMFSYTAYGRSLGSGCE